MSWKLLLQLEMSFSKVNVSGNAGRFGSFHGAAKMFLGFSGCVQCYIPLEIHVAHSCVSMTAIPVPALEFQHCYNAPCYS